MAGDAVQAPAAAAGAPSPWLAGALALGALAVFARFIAARALDVPFHDDVLDVLGFLLGFEDAASPGERLHALLAQYNDHRTTAARVVYLLARAVEGEIDFRTLTFVANAAIPLLALGCALALPRGWRAFAFALGCLVCCHPRGTGFLFWPMSGLAFNGVILWGLASLLLLARPGAACFALAAAMATAAMLSLASGQFAWIAGLGLLAVAWRRGEAAAVKRLAAWAVLSGVAVLLFHAGFANPNPFSRVIAFALATPLHHAHYVLVLLGSAPAFGSVAAATALGAAALLGLAALTPGELRRGRPVLVCFAWYLVLSVVALALGRAPYSQVDYALDARYGVFSMSLALVLALLAVQRLGRRRRQAALALLVLAPLYCAANYAVWSAPTDEALGRRVAVYNDGVYPVFGHPPAKTNAIVAEAIRRGIYSPPPRPLRVHGDGAR